ncbi:MAG: hypothetical protein LBH86_05425 [Oscillospiraceae bacterium]|nr:hypothetical protein [Oscillospiraceae bacterium]
MTGIIKKATTKWAIPNNDDGKLWWELNEKAKMDKFIYTALRKGFATAGKKPNMPAEPNVMTHIRAAMLRREENLV